MVPTSPSSNWQARRLGRGKSSIIRQDQNQDQRQKGAMVPSQLQSRAQGIPFLGCYSACVLSPWVCSRRCCVGKGPQGEPAVLPAATQITALCVEGSSPSWLCKGDTARKGDVAQRVEMHKEPGGCQAGELCAATPQLPGHSSHSPLCLFQLSRGCGPILAQVLLDVLCLVSPPCASLFWPLQHNVISSLGAAQL